MELNPDGTPRDNDAWATARQPFKAPEVNMPALVADVQNTIRFAEPLEVGKTYKTNHGDMVTMLRTEPNPEYGSPGASPDEILFYFVGSNGIWYQPNGATWTAYSEDPSAIEGNTQIDQPPIWGHK
jgi:hypothetical protein